MVVAAHNSYGAAVYRNGSFAKLRFVELVEWHGWKYG